MKMNEGTHIRDEQGIQAVLRAAKTIAVVGASTKPCWMPTGVINHQAAQMAVDAGLSVIMDRCMAVEHRLLAEVTRT